MTASSPRAAQTLRSVLAALPKVELHRHLEGAVRLSTLLEIGQQYQLPMPAQDLVRLRPFVQITAESPATVEHFLAKFEVLRNFYCSPEVIMRIARECVEDAAADNIRYMELRFTPKALAKLKGYDFRAVIEWVCVAVEEAQRQLAALGRPIMVKLICSVNRHEAVSEAEQVLLAACDFRSRGMVAFDLAGQEVGLSNRPFFDLFAKAQQLGLETTVHAGEWAGAMNIYEAITHMGARRIGHGVRVLEDPAVIDLALKTDVTFEVCLTSNVQSGVIANLHDHPLPQMATRGLRTTINTDDPSISAITLTDELYKAVTELGFSLEQIKQMMLTSAGSVFLPVDQRNSLVADLQRDLSLIHP